MMLVIENPFDVAVKFNMEMMNFRGELYPTSSCPVSPKAAIFEMWPHPIVQLFIANLVILRGVQIVSFAVQVIFRAVQIVSRAIPITSLAVQIITRDNEMFIISIQIIQRGVQIMSQLSKSSSELPKLF